MIKREIELKHDTGILYIMLSNDMWKLLIIRKKTSEILKLFVILYASAKKYLRFQLYCFTEISKFSVKQFFYVFAFKI